MYEEFLNRNSGCNPFSIQPTQLKFRAITRMGCNKFYSTRNFIYLFIFKSKMQGLRHTKA
jgi:hypothetical protein